jgi:hypothetical protein
MNRAAIVLLLSSLACGPPIPPPDDEIQPAPECESDRDCPSSFCDRATQTCMVHECTTDADCPSTEVCDQTTCLMTCTPPALAGEVCSFVTDIRSCGRLEGSRQCAGGLTCPEPEGGLGGEATCEPAQ